MKEREIELFGPLCVWCVLIESTVRPLEANRCESEAKHRHASSHLYESVSLFHSTHHFPV